MDNNYLSVSNLLKYLKNKLDSDNHLQKIAVVGEISNFINHRSGHWYFTIKDDKASISCVMFRFNNARVTFKPKSGDKVVILANTSIFEASGKLQLYCVDMMHYGLGQLYQKYEELKLRLQNQGLFKEEHKQQIPRFPFNIGLITGNKTAAYNDVISTITRRWPCCKITFKPTLVQGPTASNQLIKALNDLDQQQLDVILIVRGGGSIEDLWCFNDEQLAYTIYQAKTPIICGIGHEIDYTIADFVCDLRAPTPTGAAEIATPILTDVMMYIENCTNKLKYQMNKQILTKQQQLDELSTRNVFINPKKIIEKPKLKLVNYSNRVNNRLLSTKHQLNQYKSLQKRCITSISTTLKYEKSNLIKQQQKLINLVQIDLQNNKNQFSKYIDLLDAYSPLKVLQRGYAITMNDEQIIKSKEEAFKYDKLTIRYYDGTVATKIIKE